MKENKCYPPGQIDIKNILDFYFQVELFEDQGLILQKCCWSLYFRQALIFQKFCFSLDMLIGNELRVWICPRVNAGQWRHLPDHRWERFVCRSCELINWIDNKKTPHFSRCKFWTCHCRGNLSQVAVYTTGRENSIVNAGVWLLNNLFKVHADCMSVIILGPQCAIADAKLRHV